jgi:hypothetical protein
MRNYRYQQEHTQAASEQKLKQLSKPQHVENVKRSIVIFTDDKSILISMKGPKNKQLHHLISSLISLSKTTKKSYIAVDTSTL